MNTISELYMNPPYLDAALYALRVVPGDTLSLAADGETLHYAPAYLADRYLRNPAPVNRFPEEPPPSVTAPPWAIRLTLTLPGLERAVQDASALDDFPADAMPEL